MTLTCLDCGHAWDPNAPATPAGVDPATGEVAPTSTHNLPESFWNARPVLAHIRQAAHARARSADAVLLSTLARIAALTPPTVVLPAIVGSQASLNFLGAVIAASGAGKSSANAVARELLPIERSDVVADIPPGSGEGLAELYFEFVTEIGDDGKKQRVKRQTKNGALIYLDEGQALAEMGNRRGATLLPTMRAAWGGETIGQSNATVETHRVLRAHRYRMAIIVGFQVSYAADMLADDEGGTPQRFVYASAIDPSVPFDSPPWPGPIDVPAQPMVHGGTVIDVDPDIADSIRRRQILTQRGEYTPDRLDSHADLGRLKVAALLGLLDGRTSIELDDWDLAGQITRTSSAVRSWVAEEARAKASATERSYALKLAERAVVVEDTAATKALEAGARAVARKAHREGRPMAYGALRDAVAGKHRDLASVEDMIARAVELHWLVSAERIADPKHDQDPRQWAPGEAKPL